MLYAKNGDINIYYEVEGKGPPLVMLHGLISILEDIREAGGGGGEEAMTGYDKQRMLARSNTPL